MKWGGNMKWVGKMKVLRIAVLNIKKKKKEVLSLSVLIFLSVLFLNTGIHLMSGIENLYDRRTEQLQEAHNCVLLKNENFKPEYLDFYLEDERVEQAEVKNVVYLSEPKTVYEGGEFSQIAFFADLTETGNIGKVRIKESEVIPKEKAIYVPNSLKGYGFKIGKEIQFNTDSNLFTFTVAGFYETTFFGIVNVGGFQYYLPHESYQALEEEVGSSKCIVARCKNAADSSDVQKDFNLKAVNAATGTQPYSVIMEFSYDGMRMAYSYLGVLCASLFVGFAVIIALISLLVIRFRIQNNIEGSMVEIGALQALGYRRNEVAGVFAAEFVLTSAASALAATVFSYLLLSLAGNKIGEMLGLTWEFFWHIKGDILCILLLCGMVLLLSALSAGKVKKYPPVVAFNKGMEGHSFKKNYFPLEKGGRSFYFNLAGKEWMSAKRQNIMIFFCMAGVTFAMVFGALLFHTFSMNTETLSQMIGMEFSDIMLTLTQGTDAEEIAREIENMDGVKKTGLFKRTFMQLEGKQINVDIYDDYSKLETENVYEGRFPAYENEIVLTGTIAKELGKKIGDFVTMNYNGYQYDYLVTGLTQTMNNMGLIVKMTEAGGKRICPTLQFDQINLYLEEGEESSLMVEKLNEKFGVSVEAVGKGDTEKKQEDGTKEKSQKELVYEAVKNTAEEKIARLMKQYGVDSVDYSVLIDGVMISGNSRKYRIQSITDMNNIFSASIASYGVMFAAMAVVILLATLLIISLMLSLIIKSMLIQRKVEYGSMKALGFTTRQLMFQIAGSFMPTVLLGVPCGAWLGFLFSDHIVTFLFSSAGISRMTFEKPVILFAGIIAGLIVYAFAMAMYHAYKVRKITVYELLTD